MTDVIETLWHVVLLIAAFVAIVIVGAFLASEKRVDGYYLSTTNGNELEYCVYAHWTWHPDEKSGCFQSATEALEFAHYANQIAHGQDTQNPKPIDK